MSKNNLPLIPISPPISPILLRKCWKIRIFLAKIQKMFFKIAISEGHPLQFRTGTQNFPHTPVATSMIARLDGEVWGVLDSERYILGSLQ